MEPTTNPARTLAEAPASPKLSDHITAAMIAHQLAKAGLEYYLRYSMLDATTAAGLFDNPEPRYHQIRESAAATLFDKQAAAWIAAGRLQRYAWMAFSYQDCTRAHVAEVVRLVRALRHIARATYYAD